MERLPDALAEAAEACVVLVTNATATLPVPVPVPELDACVGETACGCGASGWRCDGAAAGAGCASRVGGEAAAAAAEGCGEEAAGAAGAAAATEGFAVCEAEAGRILCGLGCIRRNGGDGEVGSGGGTWAVGVVQTAGRHTELLEEAALGAVGFAWRTRMAVK